MTCIPPPFYSKVIYDYAGLIPFPSLSASSFYFDGFGYNFDPTLTQRGGIYLRRKPLTQDVSWDVIKIIGVCSVGLGMAFEKFVFRIHAIQRMFTRGITVDKE